jgi:hypothetical protein
MKKYIVVAEVNFEVYDTDEFSAERQGLIALARFVGDPDARGYDNEYADLPTPSIHPVTIRVEDENGKFLAGSTPATLNKVEDKEETAE